MLVGSQFKDAISVSLIPLPSPGGRRELFEGFA
jgi:hypothetical protein